MNIASIDVGTNTILLLIAKIETNGKLIPLHNEYRMPRIGKGVSESSFISDEKVSDLLSVLKEYNEIIKKYNCSHTLVVGTNLFRIANNTDEIKSLIKEKLDIDLRIVSGTEEAELSFIGATSATSTKNKIVIDIGGGSTEVVYGSGDIITYSKSFTTGVVSLTETFVKYNPPLTGELNKMDEFIHDYFSELAEKELNTFEIISVAGTPTSLSCIKQNLREYDEDKVEGSILSIEDLKYLINHFSKFKSNELAEMYPKILKGREDVILAGTILLKDLLEIVQIKHTTISGRGIRYGVVIDYMKKNK